MAAPTRPAPRPQPGWKPWASAEVVVDAMPPVATRAATATAAILVLMHMGNSIGLRRSVVARTCQLDGGMPDRVRQSRREILVIRSLSAIPVSWRGCAQLRLRSARERAHIEFIDIVEKFDEPSRAVIDQALAFLCARKRRIADRAAGVQILSLPGKGRRTPRREPAKLLLDRNGIRTKIRNRLAPYRLRIFRQHDGSLDGAAMNAVAHFLVRKQSLRHAEARPGGGDREQPVIGAQILRHQHHRSTIATMARDHDELP